MKFWKRRGLAALLAALLTALLFAALLPLCAHAEEWEGTDYRFTLPEDIAYTMTPATPASDPIWILAGVGSADTLLEDYQDMGVVGDFYTQDKRSFKLMLRTDSATAKELYDLSLLEEAELADFLDELVQARTEDVTVDKRYVDVGGQPFYRVQIDTVTASGQAHELLVGTIFNGHTLTFDIYGGQEPITPEQEALVEQALSSFEITRRDQKPESDPLAMLPLLIILLILLAVVISPLVYIPLKRRRDKREKEQYAARLTAFRKEQEGKSVGELRFFNETDCSKAVIHNFSIYHAYRRNILSLLLGIGLCALVLVSAFAFDLTWWLKVLAVAVTGLFGYRAVSMPGSIERVQNRVFSRGTSSLARYQFYDEGFRVSGIQSENIFPYFQITDVRCDGNMIYLYYSRDNAYLVSREGFKYGEAEDFAAFIQEKSREKG